jgi:hypothetical protein
MSNDPKASATGRPEEWVAFVISQTGEKKYVGNPADKEHELTHSLDASKRFPTREEANQAAVAATFGKRRRPPRGGSDQGAEFWESTPRRWIHRVGVERVQ